MFYIYLIIALVLLIMFFLFLPINVVINYSKKLKINITILGIEINIPVQNKSKQEKSRDNNVTNENNKTKKFRTKSKFKKQKSKNILSLSMSIFKIGSRSFVNIIRGLNVKDFTLNIKVSGTDSAHTALLYGKVCSLVYPFCSILISEAAPKNYSINISPNFLGEKSEVFFNLHFCGKIFQILKSLLYFVKEYNKIKDK